MLRPHGPISRRTLSVAIALMLCLVHQPMLAGALPVRPVPEPTPHNFERGGSRDLGPRMRKFPVKPGVPVGQSVRINGSVMPLAGSNGLRLNNELIMYTPSASQLVTPTNMWGAEVVVIDGAVVAVYDRQITGGPPTKIPRSGYVLSGHSIARSWLLQHAQPGAAVKLERSTAPVPEVAPAPTTPSGVEALSSVAVAGKKRAVTGVNTVRNVDDLVVYSSIFERVPSNRWGFEAVVEDGVVVSVHDRALTDVEAPRVPAKGYVLSGHGESRVWLQSNVQLGETVTLSGHASAVTSSVNGPLALPEPASSTSAALPRRLAASYVNLRQGPAAASLPDYNVFIAAFATGGGAQDMKMPALAADTEASLKDAIRADHARGARWLLSIGGGVAADRQTVIRTRAEADRVYDSLVPILDRYGFRGVDYNLENGPQGYTQEALLRLSERLRHRYGSGFAIVMTPRPYENHFFEIAAAHENAGLLDALQLQFYDVPQARDLAFLGSWITERTAAAAASGVPFAKIVVGAIADPDYAQGGNSAEAYGKSIKDLVTQQGLKGGFVWDAARERDLGFPFLVMATGL